MKITKILAAIMALALMLSLFACGDKPEETTTSKPEATEETTAPKETKETTAEDTTAEITTIEETEEPIVEETTKAEATETKTEEITTVTETTATETTATETETETVTESDTVSETDTEETTRFDYFGADMNEYVSLESGALESIEIELSSEYLIDENDVKEYIEELRLGNRIPLNNGAQVNDQAIKLGDSAYIYFNGTINGTINGEAFEESSNWEDPKPLEVVIGYDEFLPGFDEQLIGIIPSSTSKEAPIKINATFPADYWDESLAGAEAVFDVWVVYIVQYELPEYNADFILDVLEYETEESCTDVVAEFEASILAELKTEAEYREEYDKEAALADYLVDKMTVVKYPESELALYYNEIYSQLVEYKAYYEEMGMEFSSFGEFVILVLGLEEGADWQAELMESYVYPMVNQHLMIHSVAQELNITVTDEDCQAYLEEQMEESGMTAEEIIEELGGYYMLKETVLYEKMIDTLLETVIVLYV